MKPQRIAYVFSRFPKVSETFLLREMNGLKALGWEIDVFALMRERTNTSHPGVDTFLARAQFGSQQLLATVAANIRALATQPLRYLGVLARTLWHSWRSPTFLVRSLVAFPVAVRWAAIIRARGIGQIHGTFASHAAYMAYVMSQMTGIPYSFTARAHDIYSNRTMLGEKIRKAALVVTISHYNYRLLSGLYPDEAGKIHIVHGGIHIDQFGNLPKREASDGEGLRIACVARLDEMKGIIYLVQACQELKARKVAFTCVIV
ncbi:MAG TPA: hypothetical protein VKQ36_17175, partial [Ktedonobacterales bacterium]|nr:hypothetical protein [Ktedonobacterales bacterium]